MKRRIFTVSSEILQSELLFETKVCLTPLFDAASRLACPAFIKLSNSQPESLGLRRHLCRNSSSHTLCDAPLCRGFPTILRSWSCGLTSLVKLVNGRYALDQHPRMGGMSEVFPAIDFANRASKVAVKLFKRVEIEGDILRETYDREIRALKELKHPSIVELLDSGIDRDTNSLFLVLEWMDTDLSATGKVPISAGWDSFYQELGSPILQALAFAHS